MGIEPTSSAWKADILADVRCPRMQEEVYHVLAKMSSPNFLLSGSYLNCVVRYTVPTPAPTVSRPSITPGTVV